MGEERFAIKPYGVRYKCECGGEMKPSSHVLMSFPPQYPHECDKCGKGVNLTERYPTVKWEESIDHGPQATDPTESPSDSGSRIGGSYE